MPATAVRESGRYPGAPRPEARTPTRTSSSLRLVAGASLAVLTTLAACSGGATPAVTGSAGPTSATGSATATPSATTIARSYLSGRPGGRNGPVLAVKLDNTPVSNPWCGLKEADLVYLEQVEGGLSRYMALFSSQYPTSVGPVRSARISDIELLRQYGKVAFAYSGAQTKMRPVLAAAYLYDVSDDRSGLGYRRDYNRIAPDNLFGTPSVLLRRAAHPALAKNVGFTFAEAVPPGGHPARVLTTGYPATAVSFTWDPTSGRYLAAMNGVRAMACEGGQLGGTTVIIQYVRVTTSIYHDFRGSYTPMSTSVGSGTALILRNGMLWHATWTRPSAASGTRWLVNGHDFLLAPGQLWVLLINRKNPARSAP